MKPVSRIIPTNEGEGYGPNTTLRLYESDVKLFGQGDQIGKLSTLEIISSGKDFNNDPTLLPTINPPIVMTLRNMPDKAFLNGELIEQRDATGKICATGRVDFWRNGQNILRLKNVTGKFEKSYDIYGTSLRSTADIQKIYVAKIDPVIGPTSTSIGGYQSDRSKLSAVSQKVQDGIYYQDYSYVVKSTVSINDWRDFVKKFTHPAGFNLFGEVLIESFGNARKPATIDTPQSGIKDNGFGSVITVIEPGVIGVTAALSPERLLNLTFVLTRSRENVVLVLLTTANRTMWRLRCLTSLCLLDLTVLCKWTVRLLAQEPSLCLRKTLTSL